MVCQKVDDQCATWDRANGVCLSCYKGYNATNGKCTLAQNNIPNAGFLTIGALTGIDSNGDGVIDFCKVWNGQICI